MSKISILKRTLSGLGDDAMNLAHRALARNFLSAHATQRALADELDGDVDALQAEEDAKRFAPADVLQIFGEETNHSVEIQTPLMFAMLFKDGKSHAVELVERDEDGRATKRICLHRDALEEPKEEDAEEKTVVISIDTGKGGKQHFRVPASCA